MLMVWEPIWNNAMQLYRRKLELPQYRAYAEDEEARDRLFHDCLKQAEMESRTQGGTVCSLRSH